MKKSFKRFLSLLMAVLMVVTSVNLPVYAAGEVVESEKSVDSEAELGAALADGFGVIFENDITVDTSFSTNDGAVIDLNGKTLYLNVENSCFNNTTIKNGNIVIGKDDVNVCDGYFLVNAGKTLTLSNVNLKSSKDGYKGYTIFHLKEAANLELTGSTINVANNEYAGSIMYTGNANSNVTISNTTIAAENMGRGFVHGNITLTNSKVTLTGTAANGMEHGFNRSTLTVNDSDITISGGAGRGITAYTGDITITGDSNVVIHDMGAATIELHEGKNLIIAETATVKVDAEVSNKSNGTVTGNVSKYMEAELPTATVTKIANKDLTFALNFKADEATEAQLAVYGEWYADFVLTVNKDVTFNANGGADGYLSGQYDAWNENWVNVPLENVTLNANESLKIMEYAAKLMGQSGLKLTYNDVYSFVKDFDCGVFFEEKFLAANPDLEVTLELRMYNPKDASESYTIGKTYEYTVKDVATELPTATVTKIANKDLTFALNFKADEVTDEQLAYYEDWYADFVLTVNKDVTFNANGGEDGYLSGQYDAWNENWVNVPLENVTLKANESLKIMEYAAKLMGQSGLKLTYKDVYSFVKDFNCGVFFEEEFLAANPDLEVTLELRMYNPEDASESYTIGETYEYTIVDTKAASIVDAEGNVEYFDTLAAAFAAANAAESATVTLLENVELNESIKVTGNVTLELNGKTITGTDKNEKGNFYLFNNVGTFTIQDTAVARTAGAITLVAETDRDWNASSVVIANNPGGKLTVESGTIEHLGGTDMAYAIDNLTNGKGTYAETVIEGGTIKSTYRAVRQFLNGVEATNILEITGGEITGENKAVFFHDPSTKANSGTLTIGKDAKVNGDVYLFVTAGSTEWPVEVSIAASAVNGEVLTANLPEGYRVVKGEDGTYGLKVATIYEVATKAELDAAIKKAVAGDIVKLTANIDYGTDQLAIDKEITLDLGGNVLTTNNAHGGMSLKGNCTVKNGTIKHQGKTAAIKAWNVVSFENLVIDVAFAEEGKVIGGIVIQSGDAVRVGTIKNVTIKGEGLTNGIETYNCGDATEPVIGSMENVTIDAKSRGLWIYAPCGTATNCDIKGGVSGIELLIKGTYSATLDLVECTVEGGTQAIYVHDEESANPGIENKGKLEITIDDATEIKGNPLTQTIARAEDVHVDEAIIEDAVAKANDTYYTTLEAAFAAANEAESATITLLEDVTSDTSFNVTGKVTLDLNGKKITGTDNSTGSYALINVQPGADFTVEGTGTITLKATNNRGWGGYSSVISNQRGTLTVNGGTIKHLGGTDMAYAIDNLTNGKGTKAVTVINDGNIISPYRAIRQFLNGVEADNILTINGGTIIGTNKSVWVQDPSVNANSGTLTISENAELYGDVYLSANADSTEWPVEVAVAKAAFMSGKVVSGNLPAGYALVETSGVYGVVNGVVAMVDGVTYTSLEAAIAAAESGDTIELLADVTANEVILIDKSLTIDGNGHKVTSSASRIFRVTTSGVEVTLNDVNMVSSAVRVGTSDIRGISVDASLSNVKLTLNNCSVDFTDPSANDWTYAVNVSGNGTGHTVTVNGGTYEGANVVNVNGANNTITVKDATLNCLYPDNDMYAGACVWVLEKQGSAVVAEGNTFNGSNAVALNLGTGTTLTESNNVDNTTVKVAKVGSVYYTSLEDAVAAATAGDRVKVLQNITLANTLMIAKGKEITLDLNGKTITGTDSNEKGNFYLINNTGNLTITGNGTITLEAKNDRDWNASSGVVANNPGGKLTVESGTIKHLGGTDMAYAIDNLTNGKGTYAETIINGGTIVSPYRAIRQFLNGTEAQNILTINGGTITGANKAVWAQDPSKAANSGTLTIDAKATLNGDVYLSVTEGSTEWPVTVSIAAAALAEGKQVLTSNLPDGYAVMKTEDIYGVVTGVVAMVGEVPYTSLAEAFAAANGKTVTLVDDVVAAETINVTGNVTLDLNGKTISGVCNGSQNHVFMVKNGATLTVKDSVGSGKITYAQGTSNIGWVIDVEGNLVLESGTIELTGKWDIGYAVDVRPNSWGTAYTKPTTFVMNGGKLISSDGAVRVASSSDAAHTNVSASFVMNGGAIDAAWDGVFVQQSDVVWDVLKVEINGGTIESDLNPIRFYGPAATSYVAGEDCVDITLNGGTLTYTATKEQTWIVEGILRTGGGTEAAGFVKAVDFAASETFANNNVAAGYRWVKGANGIFTLEEIKLEGEGTEESPFLIKTVEDLILFRDSVNAEETKYNADGVYVALAADIDLADVDWSVNIGDDCNATFKGIFDGKGHTISNLTSTETAAKSDRYICTGLFGAITGNAVIKNLEIKNVSINTGDFVGNNAAAVVGFANACTGSIENVEVTGNISINAKDVTGVGAIVGYAHEGSLNIAECTVDGNAGSALTGAAYVGGIIGYAGGKVEVTDCTVRDLDVTATSCVAGGIAGIVLNGGVVTDNVVRNVNLTAENANWKNSAAIAVGTITKSATVSAIYNKVTVNGAASDVIVGSEHKNKPTTPVAKVEARIGDVYYVSLKDALAAEGEEVTVLSTITIEAGETVTLDLNGKTVSYTSAADDADMIYNKGNLTITDSSAEKDGKLTFTYTGAANQRSNSTIVNAPGASVTVEAGTVENASAVRTNAYTYAIDSVTNSSLGATNVTINGGTVTSNYIGIRQFINSTTDNNTLTVTGGTVYGGKRAINIHNQRNNTCVTTITGGTISGGDYSLCAITETTNISVTGGDFTGSVWYSGTTGFISGGTFDEPVADEYCAEGYISFSTADGKYTVVEGTYVAQVGTVGYETLAAAIEAAGKGDTVTVLTNIALTETVKVAEGKEITLDLNGYTITGTPATAEGYSVIENKGNLTITGTGAIVCDHKLAGSTAYAVNTITNAGTLVIDGPTIENNSTATNQIGYAIDNNSTTADAIVVVKAGEMKASGSNYYDAIRQFCNSATNENSVTVEGGKVSSIWMQNPSDGSTDKNTKDVAGSVTIKGGEVTGLYLEPSTNFEAAITGGIIGEVEYFQEADGRNLTGFISGGTFKSDFLEELCADGYKKVDNGDGTYGVEETEEVPGEPIAVNKETGVEYKDLQDAIDAAQNGETVKLLTDVTMTEGLVVKKGVALELAGYTLTTDYVVTFKGAYIVDNSNPKTGLLKVEKDMVSLADVDAADNGYREDSKQYLGYNSGLPVWVAEKGGYMFAKVYMELGYEYFITSTLSDSDVFSLALRPSLGSTMNKLFVNGMADNELSVAVVLTWKNQSGDEISQSFVYKDSLIQQVYSSSSNVGLTFTCTGLKNLNNVSDITAKIVVESSLGVMATSDIIIP